MKSARTALENAGIRIPQEIYERAAQRGRGFAQTNAQALLLACAADYQGGRWTPASADVYVFDAEVIDIDRMYTDFFAGIQAIIPDILFEDVAEDLSGMTEEMTEPEDWSSPPTDGVRTVTFCCGVNEYSFTLESWGDFMNPAIVEHVNSVLENENCPGRLYSVFPDDDQMVALIYGTAERAQTVMRIVKTE